MEKITGKEWKILCVGNSFSADTTFLLPNIAHSAGIKHMKVGNLYIGGCSIPLHYANACADSPAYRYDINHGSRWYQNPNYRIREAIESEHWDWISIQHGSTQGSCYTDLQFYEPLPALIEYIKKYALADTKIAFNMTWPSEPNFPHKDMIACNGNQRLVYEKIAELTKTHILPICNLDRVCPTGTAIQNARTSRISSLSRDGYHLTLDIGRYTAGLTFLKSLTGADISAVSWAPEGVSEYARQVAVESAINAVENPFSITPSSVEIY